jgi:general secretion pathway protein G
MNKEAFTLIELLVVIAIIGILAAVVAPNAYRAIEKAKIAGTIADTRAIQSAAMDYYADTGTWPVDGIGTATMPTNGLVANDGTPGWNGPYLEKWPQMARWGGVYTFENDADRDWTDDPDPEGGDLARHVQFTLVPRGPAVVAAWMPAQAIDVQLDGKVSPFTGVVQYTWSNSVPNPDVHILVSAGVEVAVD